MNQIKNFFIVITLIFICIVMAEIIKMISIDIILKYIIISTIVIFCIYQYIKIGIILITMGIKYESDKKSILMIIFWPFTLIYLLFKK